MAAYFLDTSALVKRWIEEANSTRVRELTALDTAHHVYLARLAITEVVGAVTRRHLAARLPEAARRAVLLLIRREIRERVRVMDIGTDLWERATEVAAEHALRGADAVHVAVAAAVRQVHDATDGEAVVFVTADREQGAAAARIGLATEIL